MGVLLWVPVATWAGGGAFHTLVVVNTNSADSVELGDYYATAHGIPAHHLCEVGIDVTLNTLTTNQFNTLLRDPIQAHITNENLEAQIDFVVLCQNFPTRINNSQGLTTALFYGPRYSGTSGCAAPTSYTSNEYFHAEQAFASSDGWSSTNGFITFHLMASNLPTAKLVVDRGAAAQSSFPDAAIYLRMRGDQPRGVREQLFANTQFSFSSLPGLPLSCDFPPLYTILTGNTNVMGYHDGFPRLASCPWVYSNNSWLSGAYGDLLTSYGGYLAQLTNGTTQSTVLDWMWIGATASFGTVAEPCAYLEKFPDPLMGFYYARGFTIGESYAMAVAAPYQGLFAGDPLAAPFAAPPQISVPSHVPYQIVTGTIPVQVSAAAHSNGVPAASIDLYLDKRFHTNLATLSPTFQNKLNITVGTRTNSVMVLPGDSLMEAVSGLADAVNSDPLQTVAATARGDRLELIYKQFNHAGDNLSVEAAVDQGTAAALTLGVGLAAPHLVPSIYPARKTFYLFAHTNGAASTLANAGDTLTCIITLTNGVAVTNTLVASAGEKTTNLLERLRSAMTNSVTLAATNGVRYDRLALGAGNVVYMGGLFARTPGPDGAGIRVDYTVTPVTPSYGLRTNYNFSSFLQDWPDDIRPRASVLFHVTPTNGILDAGISLDTTTLSDGVHMIDLVARDGSSVAAPSRFSLPLIICNASPQLSLLGTNGVAVTNSEPASLLKGTDFGERQWNQAATHTFSLHNNGTAALTLTEWTTNGTGASAFQFSGIPSVIEAGGTSNCTVIFTASTSLLYEASLSIASNAIVPQTNLLFAGSGLSHTLTVQSAHGIATPSAGTHTNIESGTVLTNSVSVPAPVGGTQWVCSGWAMTGLDPISGSTTQFVMTVTNDASLTWLWTTNYWLEPTAGDHGTVTGTNAWQAAGSTTQLTATADLYYHFTHWSGEVSSTNNPLALLMDAPQTLQANFTENLAAQDTPEWWLAGYGWTTNFDAAATNDAEPDTFITWQEYIADTDPTNAASYPKMSEIVTDGSNDPLLSWPASTGRVYHLQWCNDLEDGHWTNEVLSLGSDTWTDTNPPPPTNRYYRVSPLLP
jgi:uncharacterized protein (TIGR03790 family)